MSDAKALRASLLREPNFRWMIGGGFISALGDQFTMIALPWLVLAMTRDPFTMGMVVAVMSIPRAIFILLGGAVVDRYAPKPVLMLTKFANAALLAILAGMVFTNTVSMPAVYALALMLGLSSAFTFPAGSSMVPQVVSAPQLPLANGMLMGSRQLSVLSGPLLAALVFALWGDGSGDAPNASRGLAYAFAFDCFTFLLSAWTLHKVQTPHAGPKPAAEPMFQAMAAGMAMMWRDVPMRACILYWALVSFVVGGAMQVALPVLADSRLGGASALGLLIGAHGAGLLLGMGMSGVAGKLRVGGSFGSTILLVDALAGLLLIPLAIATSIWQAGLCILLLGLLNGYIQVAVFSWIQQRVPRPMLGRAMSIFLFVVMGLAPLGAGAAGALLGWLTLGQLFVGAGVFLLVSASLAWLFTPIRHVSDAAQAG